MLLLYDNLISLFSEGICLSYLFQLIVLIKHYLFFCLSIEMLLIFLFFQDSEEDTTEMDCEEDNTVSLKN
jgi:hypothetical protein